MKILLVVPEYEPFVIGGGAQIYKKLTEHYTKLGHPVTVLYGFFPTQSFSEKVKVIKKDQITYYQLPELPTPKFIPALKIRMPLNFSSMTSLTKILKKEQPDVVHLHGYGFPAMDTIAFALYRLKIPYLVTVHGWPTKHLISSPFIKQTFQWYLDTISSFTLDKAAAISCVSSFLKDQLPKKYQAKTTVIYNGFDKKNFTLKKKVFSIRKRHHLDKKTLLILSLGRIGYLKGFQDVITALPKVLKKGQDVRYFIAGEDEGYQKTLQKLINSLDLQDQVFFLGQLDEASKKTYLDQVDIIAIPSHVEGFGLVALEAAAFNKPILVGNAAAVKEVLKGYPKLLTLSDLTKLHNIYTTKKNSFTFSQFEWQKITKSYISVLQKIA